MDKHRNLRFDVSTAPGRWIHFASIQLRSVLVYLILNSHPTDKIKANAY